MSEPLGPDSNICDVEFDCDEGKETARRILSSVSTPTYRSSRGVHRICRLPTDPPKTAKLDVHGLELRLGINSAFSVAPPSKHVSGCEYEWVDGLEIGDVPIADFPQELEELMKAQDQMTEPARASKPQSSSNKDFELDSLDDIPEGQRHHELCKAYGADLHKAGRNIVDQKLFEAAERLGISKQEVINQILPIGEKEKAKQTARRNSKFILAKDAMVGVWDDIINFRPRTIYKCGNGEFQKFKISPGTITLIGAPPALGKSALVTQMAVDALRIDKSLSALVANVEMSAEMLLKRQLSRMAVVPMKEILNATFDKSKIPDLTKAKTELESLDLRFTHSAKLVDIRAECKSTKPKILVIDYVQRFSSSNSSSSNLRDETASVMQKLREIANNETAVIVVSSVSRTNYNSDTISLDCFRDTSELEYGANDAYAFNTVKNARVSLTHTKARDGKLEDIDLVFNSDYVAFQTPPVLDDQIPGFGKDPTPVVITPELVREVKNAR